MIKQKYKNKPQCFFILPARLTKSIANILLFIFVFDILLFPLPILAKETKNTNINEIVKEIIKTSEESNQSNFLPVNPDSAIIIKKTLNLTLTAYNSLPNQTDGSPCITANGFNVCQHRKEDTVAINSLPFGAKVRIPELFGNRIFIVRDRMNRRYTERMDIWMLNYTDAVKFGKKIAKVEILD
jgi:3D (Asp-Asp-Asp) domain-containing protein